MDSTNTESMTTVASLNYVHMSYLMIGGGLKTRRNPEGSKSRNPKYQPFYDLVNIEKHPALSERFVERFYKMLTRLGKRNKATQRWKVSMFLPGLARNVLQQNGDEKLETEVPWDDDGLTDNISEKFPPDCVPNLAAEASYNPAEEWSKLPIPEPDLVHGLSLKRLIDGKPHWKKYLSENRETVQLSRGMAFPSFIHDYIVEPGSYEIAKVPFKTCLAAAAASQALRDFRMHFDTHVEDGFQEGDLDMQTVTYATCFSYLQADIYVGVFTRVKNGWEFHFQAILRYDLRNHESCARYCRAYINICEWIVGERQLWVTGLMDDFDEKLRERLQAEIAFGGAKGSTESKTTEHSMENKAAEETMNDVSDYGARDIAVNPQRRRTDKDHHSAINSTSKRIAIGGPGRPTPSSSPPDYGVHDIAVSPKRRRTENSHHNATAPTSNRVNVDGPEDLPSPLSPLEPRPNRADAKALKQAGQNNPKWEIMLLQPICGPQESRKRHGEAKETAEEGWAHDI